MQHKRHVPAARAEEAASRQTWRQHGLVVDGADVGVSSDGVVDDDALDLLRLDVLDDGVAHARQVLPTALLRDVLDVVERVDAAGWPRVFAYVDDRLWHLLRTPALRQVLSTVLSSTPQQLPGLWVHQTSPGGRGWEPHVDVAGPPTDVDGGVDRLTVWLPLTSATTETGCMMTVPGSHRQPLAQAFDLAGDVPLDDVIRLFHGARAHPAEPGDVLLWRFQTVHWGAAASRDAAHPRVSLSLEAGHPAVPAHDDVQPTWSWGAWPSFETRLFLIGRSLCVYGKDGHREPTASRFVAVGEALCQMFGS